MKTTINLLVSGQLVAALKQMFGKYSGATIKYSVQSLPSYWTMTPASRLMNEHQNRK